MNTTLFFRKKRDGANSIEMVFDNLDEYLLPHKNECVPMSGAGLLALLANIHYAHKHRNDVNHVTGDVQYLAIGTGRNTVLTVHDVGSALRGSIISRIFIKLLWFWIPALIVKRITVISEFTKKELSSIIPFAKDKIVVVHNAFCPKVNYKERTFNSKRPVILHMGTKANKNLNRTIEALKGVDCHFIIVGKLSEEQKILIQALNISYENHYDVPYSKIIDFYQNCDIVSFPSTYEGFGVPILEANAAGRPVIAGDIPVLHEVADDAACFVDPFSVESIREGFCRLLNNSEYRKCLVERGFDNIKRFTPELMAEKYNKIYKTLNS